MVAVFHFGGDAVDVRAQAFLFCIVAAILILGACAPFPSNWAAAVI
jgi:hypothetical protein